MKKIALFIFVVLCCSLCLSSCAMADGSSYGGAGGHDRYRRYYLVKSAPQKKSFSIDEGATAFVTLSDFNKMFLISYNGTVTLTVKAEGFLITDLSGASAENELTLVYDKVYGEPRYPDLLEFHFEYLGNGKSAGVITFEATPSTFDYPSDEMWYLKSSMYYAVNSNKIVFFDTEAEAEMQVKFWLF